MSADRTSLFNKLNSLTKDVLKSSFLTETVRGRKTKQDLINLILTSGLTIEQYCLLDDLICTRQNDRLHRQNQRRLRNTENQRKRRRAISHTAQSAIVTNYIPTHSSQRHSLSLHYINWRTYEVALQSHYCPHCNAWRFVGESSTFCCNGGKYVIPPLPPLPREYSIILAYPKISQMSRVLNNLFSFTSIGAGDRNSIGFYNRKPPAFVAAHGRVYHRLFSADHAPDNSLRWYLFDQLDEQLEAGVNFKLPSYIVIAARTALERVNPYIRGLRCLSQEAIEHNISIAIRERVTDGEVSAIMCLDNTTNVEPRQVRIWPTNSDEFQYISSLSPFYETLQYVMLFPQATPVYSPTDRRSHNLFQQTENQLQHTQVTEIWRYRSFILREERFLRMGRLAQEYAVDMFSRVQESRLRYIKDNQKRLRAEEAELMGDDYDIADHDNIFLPSSFLGSRKWCTTQTADALCLARWGGQPTFFITITCNPSWPEITKYLPSAWHLQCHDVPSIAIRVFKLHLSQMFKDLKRVFGSPVYRVHVIEFQKRGLPHSHIAIKFADPYIDPHEIDKVISACLPDNADDCALVEEFMVHKHHGTGDKPSEKDGCRKRNGSCRHHYPKPLADTTHIDPTTGHVIYKRLTERDRWVVPHNIAFLRRHFCHINFEIAGTVTLFQYLYKYIYKPGDRASFRFVQKNEPIDEIRDFIQGRYICASEALWRILGYHTTKKQPCVECLPVHLQNRNIQKYSSSSSDNSISLLERYFLRPRLEPFKSQTYVEYYQSNVLSPCSTAYQLRVGEHFQISSNNVPPYVIKPRPTAKIQKLARITSLKPSHGEPFYLRAILLRRPVLDWIDARTVNEIVYDTYQTAAIALGILDSHNEGYLAFEEAVQNLATPTQLRFLFTELISDGSPAQPIWNTFHEEMAKDFCQRMHAEEAINELLITINSVLEERGQNVTDFGLPMPQHHSHEVSRELERWRSQEDEFRCEALRRITIMNTEQLAVFDRVMQSIHNDQPLILFLQARAGCGKTFVIDTICQALRSEHRIVLPTASTALAASIYAGGRTAHSLYCIPVEDHSTLLKSTVTSRSGRADLLKSADLHILDEAPMSNKTVPQCIDDLLRMLQNCTQPFGRKRILFSGDWAQIPPVIKGGCRQSVVAASIKSSYLWPSFDVMHLTQRIRNATDPNFVQWVDSLADNEHPMDIQIPFHLISTCQTRDDLIQFVFSSHTLNNPYLAVQHSILCPLNVQASEYNNRILDLLPGHETIFYSTDSVVEDDNGSIDDPMADIDQLNCMRLPGIPDHELHLKVGAVCVLTRNFSVARNLTKNTKVVIHELGQRVIVAKVIPTSSSSHQNLETIMLPRIDFNHYFPDKGWTIKRRQFPLRLAYASTINSAQGMTLARIGVDCTHPVFSHGQLYTSFSRVPSAANCMIRISPDQLCIRNVVYSELLDVT